MKNETKFPINSIDLCANEVRVSAHGLQKLAEIALVRSRTDCENSLRDVQNSFAYGKPEDRQRERIRAESAARSLEFAARDLALAIRFYSAAESLVGGERDVLTLYPQSLPAKG